VVEDDAEFADFRDLGPCFDAIVAFNAQNPNNNKFSATKQKITPLKQ